jgi:hypothetical protein
MSSVTLYPKRSSMIWLLVGSSVFVAIGMWMGATGEMVGYAFGAFFALGIPVALIQLVPGSAYLCLDQRGFTVRSLFRTSFVPWSAVDRFFVVTLRTAGTIKVREMVGWNFRASYDRARLARRVATIVSKCEGALPDTYGQKAEELAALMNGYLDGRRDRAQETHERL